MVKGTLLDELLKLDDMECEEIATFDGGNDSGGFEILITLDAEKESELYNILDDTLDYGGWAGNFSAGGTVRFDKNEKTLYIEGEELDEETPNNETTIEIPYNFKKYHYDSFSISRNMSNDDNWDYDEKIIISSGFIEEDFQKDFNKLISDIDNAISESESSQIRINEIFLKKEGIIKINGFDYLEHSISESYTFE